MISPTFSPARPRKTPPGTDRQSRKVGKNEVVEGSVRILASDNSPQAFLLPNIPRWERNQNHRDRPNAASSAAARSPGGKSGDAAGTKSVTAPNAAEGADQTSSAEPINKRPKPSECSRRGKGSVLGEVGDRKDRASPYVRPCYFPELTPQGQGASACGKPSQYARVSNGLAVAETREATLVKKTVSR